MAKGLLLVFSNARDEASIAEFNKWYDDVHIGDVLKVDGFLAATRYRIHPATAEASPVAPLLAVYEVEGEPLTSVLAALQEAMTSGAMRTSDLAQLDPPPTVLLVEPLSEHRVAGDAR